MSSLHFQAAHTGDLLGALTNAHQTLLVEIVQSAGTYALQKFDERLPSVFELVFKMR